MAEARMEENRKTVEPLFFLNSEVNQEAGKWLDTLEICLAVCDVVTDDSVVEGAQRIGGLWRIYLTNVDARAQLLCTGITLRGLQVSLKDRNPFLSFMGKGYVETTRLYVRNIPLSFDNNEIEKALKGKKVEMTGPLKYVRARTKEGKLTNFKTGDRFIDIVVPQEPLHNRLEMGIFTASIYHKEQKQKKEDVECGNCRLKGHVRRACENDPVCYACSQSGHKRGSEMCPEFQKQGGHDMDSIKKSEDTELSEALDDHDEEVSGEETDGDDEDENNESTESKNTEENTGLDAKVGKVVSDKVSKIKDASEASVRDKSPNQNKGQQPLISHIWSAGSSKSSPANSPANSPSRSSRVRTMADRTPEEIERGQKQRRTKSKGKKDK